MVTLNLTLCSVEIIHLSYKSSIPSTNNTGHNTNPEAFCSSFDSEFFGKFAVVFNALDNLASLQIKVLLQDWQDSGPALSLSSERIEEVEKPVYLGSCISAGGGVSDEINARIVKARAAYANLGHLWRLRDVGLAVKGWIYNASVKAVLLHACETWPSS
ncbi:unnamed protein product [Schistosoma mattheei]|uniref:Uncharacterized protein n=1 Tax=Schistosoma mattheei TaxID=31246 RepID=A0A183P1X3_9TREM|nr:unnamed protein product [Schistosoma mattheei]